MSAPRDLSGAWIGAFRYDDPSLRPVPFEALMVQEGGALWGETVEPNSFRDDQGGELSAEIFGAVDGGLVAFTKRYVGFQQIDDPVYEGAVSADFSRIDGRWTFPVQPGHGGRFFMIRAPMAARGRARRRALARSADGR